MYIPYIFNLLNYLGNILMPLFCRNEKLGTGITLIETFSCMFTGNRKRQISNRIEDGQLLHTEQSNQFVVKFVPHFILIPRS
jgi:hypothetical protein